MKNWKKRLCAAAILLVGLFLVACTSKAAKAVEKVELGQKYLTEMNYTEAVAAFTEVIKIDPSSIEAYAGRAEAYKALKQYGKAKADYTTVIEKTDDMPYMQAQAYAGRAEVYDLMDDLTAAESDYSAAIGLLDTEGVGKKENIAENLVRELKIKVLQFHAELCKKLGLYDKAMENYAKLARLGLDVEESFMEIEKMMNEENEKPELNEILPDKNDIISTINRVRAANGLNPLIEGEDAVASAEEFLDRARRMCAGQVISEEERYQWSLGEYQFYGYAGYTGAPSGFYDDMIWGWAEDPEQEDSTSYAVVCGEGTTVGVAMDRLADGKLHIIIVTL